MSCSECDRKQVVIEELLRLLKPAPQINTPPPIVWPAPTFDPSRCPCNPALGGSGICGCVRGDNQITC